MLAGWSCSLANDAERKPIPSVAFISPNGKCFKGRAKVLKELGLSRSSDETEDDDEDMTSSNGHIFDRARHNERQLSTAASAVASARIYRNSGVSPFGLLEELFVENPWRLLISTIMLNRTTRCQVDSVLHEFLEKWPDAQSASSADEDELAKVITPLGLGRRRAQGIIRFSKEWLELLESEAHTAPDETSAAFCLTREQVMGLHQVGNYAADAYKVFVLFENDAVTTDHALQIFVDYHRGIAKARNELR